MGVGMNPILRFSGAVTRDPAISAWMNDHPGELGAIARQWFGVIRARGNEVSDLLHDGCPTACIADAAFAYVNAFRAHVNVGFVRGAELADPAGLLEGTGKYGRHVKLRPGVDIDAMALTNLIESASADMKRRVEAEGSGNVKTFVAETADQWHQWLDEHSDSESEVWLVFHKQHTGVGSIAYPDALDEALCFGWVDSLVKRLDESRYARKFTPRKADSRWSAINRKRYATLKAAGRLQPGGIDRAPTDPRYGPRPPRFQMPAALPRYIQAALRKHPAASRYFDGLAPSHRRRYVGWIESAKREGTKARRLAEAIRLLAAGKPLGLK